MTKFWTLEDMPSQKGRTIVVTGTGGLGFEDAVALARAGGDVIIAGRNPAKGAEAIRRIRQDVPNASVTFEAIDLGDLGSIAAFSQRLKGERDHIDVLINNAGVMTPPTRKTTVDGFELQFGTNYLGHFALTAQLLPLLMRGEAPRVVTLSSVAVRGGNAAINFSDLQAEHDYKPMPVYSQSKLACLMFALELQRRSKSAGWGITSIAAHPGHLTHRPASQRAGTGERPRAPQIVAVVPVSAGGARRTAHPFRSHVKCGTRWRLLRAPINSARREDIPQYRKSPPRHWKRMSRTVCGRRPNN